MIQISRTADGIATLTLASPPLNLLDSQTDQQLLSAARELAADPAVRVVIVTGAGTKAFSCGDDVTEFPGLAASSRIRDKLALENDAMDALASLPQPVIAAIHGYALGGGLELALCCDLRVAERSAVLGFPEVRLGVFPGSGGLIRLPRLVGEATAKRLMFLGVLIPAEEATRIGLVDEVANDGALKRAEELARTLSSFSQPALRAIKRGIPEIQVMPYDAAVRYSLDLSSEIFQTAEATEGVSAFLEKRASRVR